MSTPRLVLQRIMGIEPISSVWKTEVIATIPYPHFQLATNPIGTTSHETLSVQHEPRLITSEVLLFSEVCHVF